MRPSAYCSSLLPLPTRFILPMSRRTAFVFLAVALTLVACQPAADGPRPGVIVGDTVGVPSLAIEGLPDDLPVWTVDPLPIFSVRGDGPPFLSDVGEVEVLSDGRLVVEDNQSAELWLFDPSAAPVRLAARGDGPGEIRNVQSLRVGAADSIFVFDRRHARMTILGPAGRVAEVIDLPRGAEGDGALLVSAWPLGDMILLHSIRFSDPGDLSEGMRLGSQESIIRLADRSGRPSDRSEHFRAGLALINQRFDGRSPFAADPAVGVRGDRIVHARGPDYRLEVRDPDLALTRSIDWPGLRRSLGTDEVSRVRAEAEERFASAGRASPERVRALLDQLFAPDVVPDELPALGTVEVDQTGAIWVQRFRMGSEEWDQNDAWHVLDPSGRPLARVELTSDTRLAAIQDNHVVLVHRDELEVQHIGVHTLQRSPPR